MITIGTTNYYSLLLSFKIKKKMTLRKLMMAYCNKKGLDFQAVRFWYEISPS